MIRGESSSIQSAAIARQPVVGQGGLQHAVETNASSQSPRTVFAESVSRQRSLVAFDNIKPASLSIRLVSYKLVARQGGVDLDQGDPPSIPAGGVVAQQIPADGGSLIGLCRDHAGSVASAYPGCDGAGGGPIDAAATDR